MTDVTVCIPAWQAEPFIDRTLDCARAQTHAALRIVVSVDAGNDATADRCRAHAAVDPRVEVIEQPVRLGWSANANDLLARVRTEFACLYFHDDIIEPTFVERLRAALLADPGAASAHCDLVRFGDRIGVEPGRDYAGGPPRRLLEFLLAAEKGTPLRSLMRRPLLERGLRFPDIGSDGPWRCFPFLLQLLAGGRARRVPEPLYRRWFRPGSLTTTWHAPDRDGVLDAQRACAIACLAQVDAVPASPAQREALVFALAQFLLLWTRRLEEAMPARAQPIQPADLHPRFAGIDAMGASPALADAAPALLPWAQAQAGLLRSIEAAIAARAAVPA